MTTKDTTSPAFLWALEQEKKRREQREQRVAVLQQKIDSLIGELHGLRRLVEEVAG